MKYVTGPALLVVLLLTSGCTSAQRTSSFSTTVAGTVISQIAATAEVVALRTSVAGTVVAQVAGTPTLRVIAIASPQPSDMPQPPKMPTLDNQITIPSTWQTYRDPGGKFSLRYPEDWSLTEAKGQTLTFQASIFNLAMVTIYDTSLPFTALGRTKRHRIRIA